MLTHTGYRRFFPFIVVPIVIFLFNLVFIENVVDIIYDYDERDEGWTIIPGSDGISACCRRRLPLVTQLCTDYDG